MTSASAVDQIYKYLVKVPGNIFLIFVIAHFRETRSMLGILFIVGDFLGDFHQQFLFSLLTKIKKHRIFDINQKLIKNTVFSVNPSQSF